MCGQKNGQHGKKFGVKRWLFKYLFVLCGGERAVALLKYKKKRRNCEESGNVFRVCAVNITNKKNKINKNSSVH